MRKECHFVPFRSTAVEAVGIEFYQNYIRVEFMEIDLNLEYMLLSGGLDLYFAEVNCSPFLLHNMPPIDNSPPTAPLLAARLR